MTNSPLVLVVLIVAVAIVVAFMVWRGVGGNFHFGKWLGFAVNDAPKQGPKVAVANEVTVGGTVGNIVGVKSGLQPTDAMPSEVDVANKLEVSSGGKVGDITGIDISGGEHNGPKP